MFIQVRLMSLSLFFVAGYEEKLEIKTAELSNFLDMMRSASADENGGFSTSRTDWKVGYLLYNFDQVLFYFYPIDNFILQGEKNSMD